MKTILIPVLIKNCGSWIETTIEQISNICYPKSKINLVFLENDSNDDSYDRIFMGLNKYVVSQANRYASISVYKKDFGFKLPHTARHVPEFQPTRYAIFSKIRNFIVDNCVEGNDYVFWIDADTKKIPRNAIERMLEFDKDIIMPLYILEGENGPVYYDQTTMKMVNDDLKPISDFISSYPYNSLIEVDSTDGSIFCKAEIYNKCGRYSHEIRSESFTFSTKAKQNGYRLFLSTEIKIVHQSINGMIRPK